MGIAFAILSGLSFACGNIVAKKALDQSTLRYSIWITSLVNLLLFATIDIIYRLTATNPAPITTTGTLIFIAAGFLTTFLGRKTLYISFQSIGPSRGSAIKNSSPIFTLLVAFLFLHESMSTSALIGVIIVIIGILLQGLAMFRETAGTPNSGSALQGYFFAIASATLFGVGLAVRSPGMEEIPDPYFGALMSAVVTLFFATGEEIYTNGPKAFPSFIKNCFKLENRWYYVAGVCTSMGVGSFFIAISLMQVSIVATIAAIEPLLTILLSVIILKKTEVITRFTVLSAVVVILGVAFIMLG